MQTERKMPRYGRTSETLDTSRQPGYATYGPAGRASILELRAGEYLKGR